MHAFRLVSTLALAVAAQGLMNPTCKFFMSSRCDTWFDSAQRPIDVEQEAGLCTFNYRPYIKCDFDPEGLHFIVQQYPTIEEDYDACENSQNYRIVFDSRGKHVESGHCVRVSWRRRREAYKIHVFR
jgi:hypothetical protein